MSVIGALAMMGFAFALCPGERRRHVNRRTVAMGIAVLVGMAVLVLRTPVRALFSLANTGVERLLAFSHESSPS